MTTPESMAAEARRIAAHAPGHRGTTLIRYSHSEMIVACSYDLNTDCLIYTAGGIAVTAERMRQVLDRYEHQRRS
jgi:tRNA(Phe) wybutosine-synthesizing methylase Tyw3